ncbi:MAG: hypothetical protein ACPGJS_20505 [Flammeovirgaceae bacterium]
MMNYRNCLLIVSIFWIFSACNSGPKQSIIAESDGFSEYVYEFLVPYINTEDRLSKLTNKSANQELTHYQQELTIETDLAISERDLLLPICQQHIEEYIHQNGGKVLEKGVLSKQHYEGKYIHYKGEELMGKLEIWLKKENDNNLELTITIIEK